MAKYEELSLKEEIDEEIVEEIEEQEQWEELPREKRRTRRNEKMRKLYLRGSIRRLLVAAVLAAATLVFYAWASMNPEFVNTSYRRFSGDVLYAMSKVSGVVPFSLAEILLYLAILTGVVAVIRLLWVLITGPRRFRYLLRFVSVVTLVGVCFVSAFTVLWGINYRSCDLAQQMGYTVKSRPKEELIALNEYIVEKANAYAALVERDENGSVVFEPGLSEMAKRVAAEFSLTSGRKEAPTKAILASVPMSYSQITGIFIPFTAESNVNTNNITADLPFVMAHELAHRYPIAPEDVCNFMAFYVLEDAEDPLLRYSAYLSAIRYCQNRLYGEDYDEFARIYGMYSPEVGKDLEDYRAHWKQYEGKVADVSNKVNDSYLVIQGQPDGVKSYGRMVDLMLAWFEAEIGFEQ